MGTFTEHIGKGKSNLFFLGQLNKNISNNWDWQVTVSFYTALHLICGHVENKTGQNYASHTAIQDAINPERQLSLGKLDEETYKAYIKLYQLSRRARYMVHENPTQRGSEVFNCVVTVDKHFKKAISYLQTIIDYMKKTHALSFEITEIKCVELNNSTFDNFKIINI